MVLAAKAEPIGRGLLHGRGDKRRARPGLDAVGGQVRYGIAGTLQGLQDRFGMRLVFGMECLAVDAMQFGLEGAVFGQPGILLGQGGAFVFVFFVVADEGFPLLGQFGVRFGGKDRRESASILWGQRSGFPVPV